MILFQAVEEVTLYPYPSRGQPDRYSFLFEKEAILENHFWAKGYCVDTVGIDAEMIRKYVKHQEKIE
ncbi:MAG: transposase [Methylococcales bacterium]